MDYESLGKRIRMKRVAKKLSQQEVAKAINISVTFYGNIERGKRVPSLDTFVAIANYLQARTDVLLMDSLEVSSLHRSPDDKRVLYQYLRDQVDELNFDE